MEQSISSQDNNENIVGTESSNGIPSNTQHTSVIVAVRVRPLSTLEASRGKQNCCIQVDKQDTIVIGKDKTFTFDHVFDSGTSQEQLYNGIVLPLISGIFQGFHSCLFAYGQTGSGKTYTMGTNCFGPVTPTHGMIPRVIQDICNHAKTMTKEYEISLKVSFIEIYNEDVRDLLRQHSKRSIDGISNPPPSTKIQVREDERGNVFLEGVNEIVIQTYEDAIACLESGAIHRATASHDLNERSSRSHAVFTIYLSKRPLQGPKTDEKIVSQFQLVDLAGSERAKRTNAEGTRLKEGISINTSLLALMEVISVLGDEKKRGSHVPYRRSKLTRILTNSLGGNSKTAMIACISPSEDSMQETLNTLKYAHRARNIRNKPVVNYDTTFSELQELRKKVAQLQEELAAAYESNGVARYPNSYQDEERKRCKEDSAEYHSLVEKYQQELKSLKHYAHYLKLERDILTIQIENMVETNKRQKKQDLFRFASHNISESPKKDSEEQQKSEEFSMEQVTPDTSLNSITTQEEEDIKEDVKENLVEWFLEDIFEYSSFNGGEEEQQQHASEKIGSGSSLRSIEEKNLETCLEEIRRILSDEEYALRKVAHMERFLLLECNKHQRLIATKREELRAQQDQLRDLMLHQVTHSMETKEEKDGLDKFQQDTREMERLEKNHYRLETFLTKCKDVKSTLLEDLKQLRKFQLHIGRQLEMSSKRPGFTSPLRSTTNPQEVKQQQLLQHRSYSKAVELIQSLETDLLSILKEKLSMEETIHQAVQQEMAVVNKNATHAVLDAVASHHQSENEEREHKADFGCTFLPFSDTESSWDILHLQDTLEALDIEIEYRKQRMQQGEDILSHSIQKCKSLFDKIYLLPNVSLQVRITLLEFVKRWLKSQEQLGYLKHTQQKLRQELDNIVFHCVSSLNQTTKWQALEMSSWKTRECLRDLEMIEKLISFDGYEEYNEENQRDDNLERRISNTFLSSVENGLDAASPLFFEEATTNDRNQRYSSDLFELDWSDIEVENVLT